MMIQDFDTMSEEEAEDQQIIWEQNDRYAIIAFLFLSIDRKMSVKDMKNLDAFMGISQEKSTNGSENADDNPAKLRKVRDAIIREGEAFLDSLERDESYCDYVLDEIDRIIEGNEKCGIGNGYSLWGTVSIQKALAGAPYILFDYFKLVISDNDCSKNQKRLLKHIAQKWDIDKSMLSVLESCAKALYEICKKRFEIEHSDTPHREALAAISLLDTEEKSVWKKLNELHIAKDHATSAYIAYTNAMADVIELFGGSPYRVKIRDEDDPEEEVEIEDPTIWDKIGEGFADGVDKISDIICAPINFLTDKLMDLTFKV